VLVSQNRQRFRRQTIPTTNTLTKVALRFVLALVAVARGTAFLLLLPGIRQQQFMKGQRLYTHRFS
jgi:hypothetical protein